jgi:hypothetical protein
MEGDDQVFTWQEQGVSVTVRSIVSGRDGPRAEVWANHSVAGHLHTSMVNLLSNTSKHNFVKAVSARDHGSNWAEIVEQVSVLATQKFRAGEPLDVLEPRRRPEAGQFAVRPIIPKGTTTLWYGDGKSAKSYTLEAACYAMATGTALAGLVAEHMTPSFLDWEWDKSEHEDRLLRLGGETTLFYRRCNVPLHEQAKAIKRELDRVGVDFVGIDSLGMACGGDPADAEVALRFFEAVRFLGRTAVVVHHVPKEKKDPYGSAYIRNSARSGWFFSRVATAGEDELCVALIHRWTNTGKQEQPIGLQYTFCDETYTTDIQRTEAKPLMRVAGELSKKQAIESVLAEHSGLELWEITAMLDEDKDRIAVHLSQMKKQGRLVNEDGKWYLTTDREEGT